MIDHGLARRARVRRECKGPRPSPPERRAASALLATPGVKRGDRKLLVKLGAQIGQSAAAQGFQRRRPPILKGNRRKFSGKTQLIHRAILLKPLAKRPARQGHFRTKPVKQIFPAARAAAQSSPHRRASGPRRPGARPAVQEALPPCSPRMQCSRTMSHRTHPMR